MQLFLKTLSSCIRKHDDVYYISHLAGLVEPGLYAMSTANTTVRPSCL